MLTLERAQGASRGRRDRHGRRRLHGHARAADGQTPTRASSSSSETDAGHAVEGCNYLLALEMEMDPVPGYEIASWEQRLRRLRHRARPRDAAPDSVARRRRRSSSATSCGTTARRSRPRRGRCCARRSSGRRRSASRRCSAPSSSSSSSRRPTRRRTRWATTGLTPSVPYILDYHILATTYDEPLHPADPERHARRGHPRSRPRRARRGPASRRSTSASRTR